MKFATYDAEASYRTNFDQAPDRVDVEVPEINGNWTFCGLSVASPLGVPAGPLLNGKWCLYYASLGFDVLTYKTVRSGQRDCYPLPNLVPVLCDQLSGDEQLLRASDMMLGSWAVSFGMPSSEPDFWRHDIEQTKRALGEGQLLSVSVVGTIQEGWSIEELAHDYAQCAKWAVESGADAIETNFSCPNVATCDGQLYQNQDDAEIVASAVRAAIGETPLIIKIGHQTVRYEASRLIDKMSPLVDAMAMTNSVATTVADNDGNLLFEGQQRGICGKATFHASVIQLKMFAELIHEKRLDMQLIGVGGIQSFEDVQTVLKAGGNAAHIATAAMVNPGIALEIKKAWSGR